MAQKKIKKFFVGICGLYFLLSLKKDSRKKSSIVYFLFPATGVFKFTDCNTYILCKIDFPMVKSQFLSEGSNRLMEAYNKWILTFWVTMRKRRALNWGMVGVTPGILAGSEWGESSTVLGFTIFSTSINQASRNSPVPSGRSVCSSPSDTGTFPPIDRAQLNVLNKQQNLLINIEIITI